MSNLSDRVEKAKQLSFVKIPGISRSVYSTKGSRGDTYRVSLFRKQEKETAITPDGQVSYNVITTCCKVINVGNGKLDPMENCKGNERHTVCYHCLGAIYSAMKNNSNKLVSFHETFQSADRMSFGGEIIKIQSKQGDGFVWGVIKDWPKPKVKGQFRQQLAVDLMRGKEDKEID